MLWLVCRNCGRRPVDEFSYGGEVRAVPDWITDPAARDIDFVWMSSNVDGPTAERWFHAAGCRRWTTIDRDTATDTIIS